MRHLCTFWIILDLRKRRHAPRQVDGDLFLADAGRKHRLVSGKTLQKLCNVDIAIINHPPNHHK